MKRNIIALLLALTLIGMLTACGASSKEAAVSPSFAPEMPVAAPAEAEMKGMDYGSDMAYTAENGGGTPEPAPAGDAVEQKMVYTANLELETTDFTSTVNALTGLVESLGGYMENSDIGNRGAGYQWASFTVRVPTAQYDAFLRQAGELCHETWRSASQQNITESYYDTQGRLETQKIKLDRLQELLSKAENMEDIITIESAISETEWMIEDLSGTLRHYDALVDYATVYLNLSEVSRLSNVEEAPIGFFGRMSSAFTSGWSGFVDGMEDLAVGLAYSWMWLLVLAAIIVLAVKIVRSRLHRRKLAKAEKNAKKADDKPAEL